MTPVLTENERKRLGLEGWIESEVEVLDVGYDDSARGAGVGEKGLAAALALGFFAAQIPLLNKRGFELECSPGSDWVRVLATSGEGLRANSVSNDPGAVLSRPDDPAVYINLEEGPAFATLAGGVGVALRKTQSKLTAGILEVAPLADVVVEIPDEDVRGWTESCRDELVRNLMAQHLAAGGPWGVGVAAGLHARLPEAEAPEAGPWLERFVQGEVDPHLALARVWARELEPRHLTTLRRLAVSEVQALFDELEILESEVKIDDAAWRLRIRDWCHRRDDLEGVRVLLREAGQGERIDAACISFDEEGSLFMACLPLEALREVESDERLRRVRVADPAAWWAGSDLATNRNTG